MLARYYAKTRGGSCSECILESPEEAPELGGSVGEGGANRSGDVCNVQGRLNRVGSDQGGPATPLEGDGLCGPLTKGAIKRFQQRYYMELLGDGRIDPGKNTWKKLVALSDGAESAEFAPRVPKKGSKTPAPATAADPATPSIALSLAQYRIYEAIKALDVATAELNACHLQSFLNVHTTTKALFEAYKANQSKLLELPTVDRCFHVVSETMKFEKVNDTLSRLRKMYVTMVDVIVANSFTTPKAEKNGSRRYVRIINQKLMNSIHPTVAALADAPEQGWWNKNANVSHIRIGSAYLNDDALITTLIHEMSHFCSHPSTFIVGGHVSGIYNAAFDDTHHQAVRNAFCYEWYAILASFKSQRSKPNAALLLK